MIGAKDRTIPAKSALPVIIIDNILQFPTLCNSFILMTTINICQKSRTHELVVKAVINFFRQITTEHANWVITINSINTISYLCAIIRTIRVSTWTDMWVMFDSSTGFTGQPIWHICLANCLGYESEVNLIPVCDMKQRPFISKKEKLVTNVWSYQCFIFASNRWCALFLHCWQAVGNLCTWGTRFYILYQQTTVFGEIPFFFNIEVSLSPFCFFMWFNFIDTSSYSCGNHVFVFLKTKTSGLFCSTYFDMFLFPL